MKYLYISAFAFIFSATLHAAPPPGTPAAPQATAGGINPIDALQAQIDELNVSVASLEERVTATEQNIAALQQTAADLQQQILNNDGDIASLETQLIMTNARIQQLQNELKKLEDLVALKQDIINGRCPDGQYLRQINPDGGVVCGNDAGADGIARYTVSNHYTLKACLCLFNCSPCTTTTGGTYSTSCPSGTVAVGGGYVAGDWIGVSASRLSDNSWAVDAGLAPVAWGTGSSLITQATCLQIQ